MFTTKNAIPQVLDRTITAGETALTGALAIGPVVGLKQNDATAIALRLRAVTGTPPVILGGDPILGTQSIYAEAISAAIAANAVHRDALAEARKYCYEAVDLLRRYLGRRWNSGWNAAGFTAGSLAVPTNPEPLLIQIRSYLGTHPEHGNADLGITAAGVQQQLNAIAATRQAARTKLAERVVAKADRDDSLTLLRECLAGLRAELDQLLDPDDQRWYQFGFVRPADGRTPALVKTLSLRAGLAGEIFASWSRAELATSYRLSWRVTAPGAIPTLVGLFTDRATTVTGLPSSQTVIVTITARNATGESAGTEATMVVP